MSWRDRAACRGLPLDAFFPLKPEVITDDAADACAICPVKRECLEYALGLPVRHGTYGGLSEEERGLERRRRQRRAGRGADERGAA